VLLHEFAHGLGFQTFTDDETGEEIQDIPSIWDYYLLNNRTNRTWVESTPAERAQSAVTWRGLSWNGPRVTAAVPQVLDPMSNLAISGAPPARPPATTRSATPPSARRWRTRR
jgi:hypothetical protein